MAALEAGRKPWERLWDADNCDGPRAPSNPVTGKRYHGINVLLLAMSPLAFMTGDPRWMTYQQASDRKWQVRKGKKSTGIFFFKPMEVENKDHHDGDESAERKMIGMLRSYSVFHASQIEVSPNTKCQRKKKRHGRGQKRQTSS